MGNFLLRPATVGDIPILVRHRRAMFEDMARLRGQTVMPEQYDAMDKAYFLYLQQRLGVNLMAWVIEMDGQIVASGAVVIFELLPFYRNPSGRSPYMHSVYTSPAYRRQGCARRIVQQAIEYCKEQGYNGLRLHASAEGRQLYASLGFRDTNEMRLDW